MKKREFTELIKLSITKDINPMVIEKYISMAYNTYVQNHWRNKNTHTIDLFCKLFEDVEVKEVGGQYYSVIPASIIDIPRPGSGVISIEMTGDMDLIFVPVTVTGHKTMNNLEVYKTTGPVPFTVTREKIYYQTKLYGIDKVNMRLMLKYEAYQPEDEIIFPPNSEMAIRDIVWQFLNQTPPEDKVIDSNERTK